MVTAGFENGLSVCVGNYGYYNEGELHDAWITLPKSEDEIEEFLNEHQLQDAQHEEIYISDYDELPFDLPEVFNQYTSLSDLNLLAAQLQRTNDIALEAVEAWIETYSSPDDIIDLMNLIEQADDIPYYNFNHNSYFKYLNFGLQMIEEDFELDNQLETNPILCSCIDVEKYGREYELNSDYVVLKNGYILMEDSDIMPSLYSREDLIEKYME